MTLSEMLWHIWNDEYFYPRRNPTPGSTSFNEIYKPDEARAQDIEYLHSIGRGRKMRDPDAPACSTWISPDSVTLRK